jgi:ribosome-binding factor A
MNNQYIRLNELVSLYPADNQKSRFHNFWETFYKNPESEFSALRVQAFSLIEKELSALDADSWSTLKKEVKTLCVKSGERGWNQLFEKLNEAKGYCFLKSIGCSDIEFIATKNNVETPDLIGRKNTSQVLCEVKTINVSKGLVDARINLTVMKAKNRLDEGMTKKLELTIFKAASQLNSYSESLDTEKYIYLVITYDDDIDYRDELNTQTRDLFNTMNLVGINLVIHNVE